MTENELKNASFLEELKKSNLLNRKLIKKYCGSIAECDDNGFDMDMMVLLELIETYQRDCRKIRKLEEYMKMKENHLHDN